ESDYPKALVEFLNYYSASKKLLPDDPYQAAMATNNIGMAFMNMERYDQAIEYINTSLEYAEDVEDFPFYSNAYWNLGICYMEKKEYDQALEIFKLGVEEARKIDNQYTLVGNQLCIAAVYLRQKKYEEGIEMYEEVYERSLEAKMEPFKLVEALNGIIFSHNHLARPEKSMPYVKIADSIIEANDMPDTRNLDFLLYKGTILYQLGKPQEGDAVLKRFLSAKDSLYSKKNIELIQEKETEFRTKEKEQQIDLQQAELELQQSELEAQRLLTMLLAGGSILLVLIGILVYRQQRLKIKQQKQEQQLKEALLTVETQNKLEEQRLRISKELHDNIGSQLTYLAGAAQNIGFGVGKVAPEVTEQKLQDLSTFSQEAISDLRDTIWVMNRNLVTWEDLSERLRYLAHKVSNTTGIHVDVVNEGDTTTTLNPSETMHIFRIVQEAVNNAVKHSKASKITVKVASEDTPIITVQDDGVGYTPSEITSSSNGLKNMATRAEALGAQLKFDTSATGTMVQLKLPRRT
ncbi:MAG: tetratricopeptide repeat protein, partial [Marinirhabdus sp.]|nr:tetratricopeptide repeat protein [Marinirhabdus sp.]